MIQKLTDTVFVQEITDRRDTSDWAVLDRKRTPVPTKFSHIIRFYDGGDTAKRIQQLTAESMRRAAAFARGVRLIAVLSANERVHLPAGFKSAPKVRRTVADVRQFAVRRPLPLLFDLLANGAAAAKENSYLVFTNSDICLQANFYSTVHHLLESGFDCLVINRRTVGSLEAYGDLPELAALEFGGKHPGLDCFVFPVTWLDSFVVSQACVGVGHVMRSLLYNLVVKARRMLILRDAHLTYHYGDDRPWASPGFQEYMDHNLREAQSVAAALSTEPVRQKALADFCGAHGETAIAGGLIGAKS